MAGGKRSVPSIDVALTCLGVWRISQAENYGDTVTSRDGNWRNGENTRTLAARQPTALSSRLMEGTRPVHGYILHIGPHPTHISLVSLLYAFEFGETAITCTSTVSPVRLCSM